MYRRLGLGAAITACVGVVGCGYPSFQFGPAGAGGAGSTSGTAAVTSGGRVAASGAEAASSAEASSSSAEASSVAASSGASASSSSAASSTGGLMPCGIGHLVISDIQTSGAKGATDEFVVLYNPTEGSITLDGSWTLQGTPPATLSDPLPGPTTRWTGKGAVIPPRHHFLIAGSGYEQTVAADDTLSDGIADEEDLVLATEDAPIDEVCYYNTSDPTVYTSDLTGFLYTCAGTPVYNPQDGSAAAMIDQSIARRPGYGMGSCTDTGNNAADFTIETPSMPDDVASPAD